LVSWFGFSVRQTVSLRARLCHSLIAN
jgi:hypothetical protein